MKKQIFYMGKKYDVINIYRCPWYNTAKAQFYVNGGLITTEFKECAFLLISK